MRICDNVLREYTWRESAIYRILKGLQSFRLGQGLRFELFNGRLCNHAVCNATLDRVEVRLQDWAVRVACWV
jgi:hypothetical protein